MDDTTKSVNQMNRAPIEVIVASMPEPRKKGFWRDSSQLLSLSAFLFSAATGGYATYQSWLSYREARLNHISSLIEKYYDGYEKLTSTQVSISGVLRAQQQSRAISLMREANDIKDSLDDANWNAIAQLESQQGFHEYAKDAYTIVVNRGNKSIDYLFGWRGLGYEQLILGLEEEGTDTINKAANAALASGAKKLPLPDAQLKSEAAYAYMNWLAVKGPTSDCPSYAFFYDRADMALQSLGSLDSSSERKLLDAFKPKRLQCGSGPDSMPRQ